MGGVLDNAARLSQEIWKCYKAMLYLFVAELRRNWILLCRYPLQAISGMALMFCLFLGIFTGVSYAGGSEFPRDGHLGSVVVGYLLWNAVVFAMGEIAEGLQGEARIGTIEQLYLSTSSGVSIFLARAVASQTSTLLMTAGILGLLIAITDVRLRFPLELILPLVTAIAGAYGLGLIFGSMVMLFKKIGPLVQFAQFGVLALVMVPFERIRPELANPFYLLPLVPGAALMRNLMARGQAMDWTVLGIATINGGVYLCIGIFVFCWMERRTKSLGLLGSY